MCFVYMLRVDQWEKPTVYCILLINFYKIIFNNNNKNTKYYSLQVQLVYKNCSISGLFSVGDILLYYTGNDCCDYSDYCGKSLT